MGCIASTAICRSIRIREELSNGFQSSASQVVISSNSSNDMLFELLCSSKLTTSSFKLPNFDEVADGESSRPDDDDGDGEASLQRSKSCHLPRESEIPKLDRNDRKRLGSRSFHTVEEFDALLHRMKDSKLKESDCVEETSKDSSNNILGNREHENGWKRKAVGKGLKSLDVPSIEFPAVARFKGSNGLVCPASYATPKFGSYNVGPTQQEEAESRVFSPELVAAFEDCMQQLQLEQDTILMEMEMDEYSWADDEMEKVEHNV